MTDSLHTRKTRIPFAQIHVLAASLAVIEKRLPHLTPAELDQFYQAAGPTLDRFQAVDEALYHGSIKAAYGQQPS